MEACRAVEQRATTALRIVMSGHGNLLDIALNHLTLGRAGLYQAMLDQSEIGNPKSEIDQAVAGLRRAGRSDELPKGLLTRAWVRFLAGDADGARADLDEAWEIAERGPMPLYMADIHLHRARWFRDKDSLAAARRLIDRHGYHRRDAELADAEAAAQAW